MHRAFHTVRADTAIVDATDDPRSSVPKFTVGAGAMPGVRRKATLVPVIIAAAFGAAAVFPSAAAAADSVQISIQTATPEQSVPVQISFSGTVAAANSDGDPAGLIVVVRPAGGISCQSTFSDDNAAAGGESTTLTGNNIVPTDSVGPGSYQETKSFDPPGSGSYLVCAWITDNGCCEWTTATAAASTTFSARGPQVEQLSVSLPKPARPNVAFQVAFTTQTDQQLTLDSYLKPAGGLPCASSYELESAQNQELDDLLNGGQSLFGGPTTTTATATEKKGSYVICTWVEGPTQGEVDAALSTPIDVASPPACVVPTVPRDSSLAAVETQIAAAHCGVGTVSDAHSKTVAKGDVIRLQPTAQTKLANEAKVSIVVSSGRAPKRHKRHSQRRASFAPADWSVSATSGRGVLEY
jgi:hypothetical protein